MLESIRNYFSKLTEDLVATDDTVVQLFIILVTLVIVLDAISSLAEEKREKAGLKASPKQEPDTTTPKIKTEALGSQEYVSEIQGISGKPDALIIEDGINIPVCRKPLAKKIRDRYVAQLLVYMRLLEEFEGKRPPHGYLILGKNSRRVKILNSASRQRWLDDILSEMRNIAEKSSSAKPTPSAPKCSRCSVRHTCDHSLAAARTGSPSKSSTVNHPASAKKKLKSHKEDSSNE